MGEWLSVLWFLGGNNWKACTQFSPVEEMDSKLIVQYIQKAMILNV